MTENSFIKRISILLCILMVACSSDKAKDFEQPNIMFCIADDWGWPHAGVYGDSVVQTPTFDRLAEEGVIFEHAFVSSPSCTPSRSAILTGRYHWELGESANLWSTLSVDLPVYPLILEEAGYHVGHWRKCWGPGDLKAGGYVDQNPGGKEYKEGFTQFLEARPEGVPFCFWLGASDPHRKYETGSGKASGIDLDQIAVPGFYPDEEEIRSDIADYYFEVNRFDSDIGKAIELLEETGELDNTIIVVTGDHGMPFPRCKGNLYDMGARVPLVIRWGNQVSEHKKAKDFVSLTDLAPTFLEAAGIDIPAQMSGQSLVPILLSGQEGWIEPGRDRVVFGRERHTPAQLAPSLDGYPSRGIRTAQHLYIRNFEPDRWPGGVPEGSTHPMNNFADCDNGPTKSFIIQHADDPDYRTYYDWCFGKRPTEELYDVIKDPFQLYNLAETGEYLDIKRSMAEKLEVRLRETNDPRIVGGGEKFDQYPYRARYDLKTQKSQ
jgi:arylsulfatase A-like enzyme